MTARRKDVLGHTGEHHARLALEAAGMRFVEANWRCQAGEIDLVMTDGDELVFVEVKTRRGSSAGTALEAITAPKARRLLHSGDWYVADHPAFEGVFWRIDIVAIDIDPLTGRSTLAHLRNAVFAD